ncbi:MAG: hypothetical protein KC656_28750, partial [Myxococcales bacterium]|nr:hypothetical protein [Myxococcales bacterium]
MILFASSALGGPLSAFVSSAEPVHVLVDGEEIGVAKVDQPFDFRLREGQELGLKCGETVLGGRSFSREDLRIVVREGTGPCAWSAEARLFTILGSRPQDDGAVVDLWGEGGLGDLDAALASKPPRLGAFQGLACISTCGHPSSRAIHTALREALEGLSGCTSSLAQPVESVRLTVQASGGRVTGVGATGLEGDAATCLTNGLRE